MLRSPGTVRNPCEECGTCNRLYSYVLALKPIDSEVDQNRWLRQGSQQSSSECLTIVDIIKKENKDDGIHSFRPQPIQRISFLLIFSASIDFHPLFTIRKRKSDDVSAVQKPFKSPKNGAGSWKDGAQPTGDAGTDANDYGNDHVADKAGGAELLDRKARKVTFCRDPIHSMLWYRGTNEMHATSHPCVC